MRMRSEGPRVVVVVDEGGGVGSTVGRESGVGDVVVTCGGEIVGGSRRVGVFVVDPTGSRGVRSTVLRGGRWGGWRGKKKNGAKGRRESKEVSLVDRLEVKLTSLARPWKGLFMRVSSSLDLVDP